jgi:membrane-associated phospholipid phosphatase
MKPADEMPLAESRIPGAWGRLTHWAGRIRPVVWLMGLTVSLAMFLAFLPYAMRTAIWRNLQAQRTLASMVLVFSLLAISLVWSTGQRIDVWAFLFFNVRGPRPLWLDWMMLGFTQIGNGIASLAIALVLFLAGDRLLAYVLILGTLTLWLVVELVKAVTHRSRPFIKLIQTRIVGYRAIGRSFPSGHTSQVFFVATLMARHFHASVWGVFLLYATALLVGLTRMYVGAHYPRDVLAGAILGSLWGLLGVLVNGYVLNGIG